jgi:hypothetical protein
VRKVWVVLAVTCGVLSAVLLAQQQDKSGSAEWRKAADKFMADLVANRVDDALELFEPEVFNAAGGKQRVRGMVEQFFGYCGRPLDAHFKHEERGFKLYLSGRTKPMRKFYYAGATDQHSIGVCFFAVEVVPADDSGYKVTTFGPLTLQSGQLPDWLR